MPAPIPAITARAPITPPTMGPTGVELFNIGTGAMECDGLADDVEVEIEVEIEVEVLLVIVVDVEFSLVVELDTDSVVDFDDDTVSITVSNTRSICPEYVVDIGTIAPE
jgi:hypothetical protein